MREININHSLPGREYDTYTVASEFNLPHVASRRVASPGIAFRRDILREDIIAL